MSKLQELLDEKWPIGSDKTIQGRIMNEHNRQIFTEGYNAAIEAGENPLKEYENTLFFSVADEADETGMVPADLKLYGDGDRLMAGLAEQMQRHPELEEFFDRTLCLFDKLTTQKTNNNG